MPLNLVIVIRYQVSISPKVYEQLLQVKIPKAQKDSQVFNVFLHFLDLPL